MTNSMNKALYFLLILFLLNLFPFYSVLSSETLDVAINEIAWMGSVLSPNDEWIELRNNTNNSISLNGWVLKSTDKTPEIKLIGIIPANGFYLLERTDNTTVPNITADLIYTGALKNNGETLGLYDDFENIIDEMDCSVTWFAGDNTTKQTMERKNPLLTGNNFENWQTSKSPNGTPKMKNSQNKEIESNPLTTEEKEVDEEKNEEKNIIYPLNIFINEILPSPEGSDAENEWIELYNKNDFEVEISSWKIRDTIGATKTYTISDGIKIAPNDFLILLRTQTKITLQNSGDGLELLNPAEKIVHKINFGKAPINQSFNRTSLENKSQRPETNPNVYSDFCLFAIFYLNIKNRSLRRFHYSVLITRQY